MYRKRAAVLVVVFLACGLATPAFAQDQGLKFNSDAADIGKIGAIVEEFRLDIIHKDGEDVQKLLLNPDILFHPVEGQQSIDDARKLDPKFDGIGPSALGGFLTLLATSKDQLEEKFYDTEIRQDGDLGLVTFNYDFFINGKIHHSGLEHWQLRKIDGRWKILSVTWTRYLRN